MSYLIYRVNTDEYFKGYDQKKNAVWSSISEAHKFPDRSSANSDEFNLGLRGFAILVESVKDERLKDEW